MTQSSISPSSASPMALPQVVAGQAWRPWTRFLRALRVTAGDPVLWLLGAAGFLLRGGLLVLLAPMIALPTPVEVRLLLGDSLGSGGFSGPVLFVALATALAITLLLMAALYAIAWLETWSFDRLLNVSADEAVATDRRAASRVFSVQVGGLCVLVLAALPLLLGGINTAYNELIQPSGGGPLYDRILAGVQVPLLFLAAVLVIVEAVSAVLTRRSLWRARGVRERAYGRRWRVVTAAVGWLVSLAVLVPAAWALSVTWHVVRQGLDGQLAPDPLLVTPEIVILALIWVATLLLAGFASALRGALWTVQELR